MTLSYESTTDRAGKSHLPGFLRPAPPAPFVVSNPDEIRVKYKHYQLRILIWTTLGYSMFYFVRRNIAVAMPVMEAELHVNKSVLGLFLTLQGVLYGISKFANGFLADRANGRVMMAIGLIASAAMNFFFGFSSTATALGIFWMLNGWFQGMGFPPIARLLTHWFPPKELATKMSIWNTSHTAGYAAILILTGYLVRFSWRLCFFVPAILAILMAVALLIWLRDTPESVGLPEVEGTHDPSADSSVNPSEFKSILREKVFSNPYIWLFSLANFFVYTIRYGVADWAPTMLKEAKGISLSHGSWMTAGFELAGLLGILVTGWMTDRFFAGRAGRVCVLAMILCGASLYAFQKTPAHHGWLNLFFLMAAGFFIYAPQALIGVAAANLATKRAAATAVGLTGIFGYTSTVLSGWGMGTLVQHFGWNAGLQCLIAVAAVGTLLFVATWGAQAHGYKPAPA